LPPTPPDSARSPGARERGRMRRRLRQQTRMREALLVDLGALVYELHRHGRREPELLQTKAAELTAVDSEVRALADALDAGYGMLALVSAGIAGSCERCGSLLCTDARYCSSCGANAVASLASDEPAGGDAGRGTLGDSGPEPLERQERDLDPSTDEIEAVPSPATQPEPNPNPNPNPNRSPSPNPNRSPSPRPSPKTSAPSSPMPAPRSPRKPSPIPLRPRPPRPPIRPRPRRRNSGVAAGARWGASPVRSSARGRADAWPTTPPSPRRARRPPARPVALRPSAASSCASSAARGSPCVTGDRRAGRSRSRSS